MQLIEQMEQYPPIHQIFSLLHEEKDAVFLDSSLQNHLGRYSIIGLKPYLKLVNGTSFTVNGKLSEIPFEVYVKKYLQEHKEINQTHLPITSGAIGYFSYDYGRKKENVKAHCKKDVDIPDCILIFYDHFIIEDHQEKKLWLVANDHLQDAQSGIEELKELIQRSQSLVQRDTLLVKDRKSLKKAEQVTANFEKQDYMNAVSQVMDYIVEGDICVANLTQQLKVKSCLSPYEMFEKLRKENPSPFGAYCNYGDFKIVSSSPERFLQMKKGKIVTRPIKGTRKRGATKEEDDLMKKDLAESKKDQSELLMIVDLERNDLNRVCLPGSVKVTELFKIESYATVFHLVANIEGQLRKDLTVMDLLDATFPGGSITGAPKVRAMEIIDELEHSRRNIYTGSLGYLSLDGSCDFNIIIRTALYKDQNYYLGVGGGITCESDPTFEYEETLQKAKALLQVLEEKD
ncbi:aminodeoxychorismate synthase component I [Atopobacter sp. AH10]|uniref:aminodeoxychorismate synthase component I n=1 Tax=Atopobacter sp. AH10 TaxID=2315861 RepID=UPI000EF19604|nr:aminodeoxychorismate synthase component I [Atopobacter sp. AH10]RLK63342.1 aminodeoxychorismate synthase component I [Atopobacter sp. AH10]